MKRIIAGSFNIQPGDIDASKHLFNAFDHTETEISAGWLVRFCQERGREWEPFTREEIEAFYGRTHKDGFLFNRLIEPEMVPPNAARAFAGFHDDPVPRGGGWIVVDTAGWHYFTEAFVMRCHAASPKAGAR